jgi:hypothetical protein
MRESSCLRSCPQKILHCCSSSRSHSVRGEENCKVMRRVFRGHDLNFHGIGICGEENPEASNISRKKDCKHYIAPNGRFLISDSQLLMQLDTFGVEWELPEGVNCRGAGDECNHRGYSSRNNENEHYTQTEESTQRRPGASNKVTGMGRSRQSDLRTSILDLTPRNAG